MDIYISLLCANCDEEIYQLLRTYDSHKGLPVVSATHAEQSTWYCDECEQNTIVGELEVISEDDL